MTWGGPQDSRIVPKQGSILDGPQVQGWSPRAQHGPGDSGMVPEILKWASSREAPQMVHRKQDDPSDPRMAAKQGGTLDGP